eukprot:TRINITY_DN26106_c0_g1_i1.p1 TRINITY_DN26106_c0_g1~~TRINITY_DN26106_c0_g1_i1.p1  ORF type:complete len:424 (+),score=77.90 TRINITY_DN26106_c0_g1_i1:73-1272(+)
MLRSLVGSEMCIRDRVSTQSTGTRPRMPAPFRIPVSGDDVGLSIFNLNPFLVFNLLFAPVIYWYYCMDHKRPTRLHKPYLMWFYGATLGLGISLEHYWQVLCPVAAVRFADTIDIFQHNVNFLSHTEWDTRAFVAEGTMLAVARKGKHLNIWDQDTDIFVAVDAATETDVLTTLDQMRTQLEAYYQNLELAAPVKVVMEPQRWLLQVHGANKGHGDIWLWQRAIHQGQKVIYGPDFTYASLRVPEGGYRHLESTVLPIQYIYWNGVRLPVAQDAHAMLKNQYGDGYMVPYRNRLQCMENFGDKLYPSALFFFYILMAPFMVYLLPRMMHAVGFPFALPPKKPPFGWDSGNSCVMLMLGFIVVSLVLLNSSYLPLYEQKLHVIEGLGKNDVGSQEQFMDT